MVEGTHVLPSAGSGRSAGEVAAIPHSERDAPNAADNGSLLMSIYRTLLDHYGPQHWWPTITGSRWEVMMGAVLVQRTTWRNADRALANVLAELGREGLSDPAAILAVPDGRLVEMLRPAGHFSRKLRTLKLLAQLVLELGGAEAISVSKEVTHRLRAKLLGIWGIGPETADAILLYALDRPVFVADAYALRLGSRWGLLAPVADYEQVQGAFGDNLAVDIALFNEYHALIVAHGKQLCRPAPLCHRCPLNQPVKLQAEERATTWRCPR